MSGDAASFVGNIPGHYDRELGPMIFVEALIGFQGGAGMR